MAADTYLVIGLVLAFLAIPSALSAWSSDRSPRLAAVMMMCAGVLLVLALTGKPGGYRLTDVPDVFFRVIARWI
ncbi:MAG: hypothetical protein MUF73_07670 [Rhodobacteraceae bacterium]|jgi:uncharacterized membrane protein YccC|nr:hypothetical protein [Paracoccaceae bacterium]